MKQAACWRDPYDKELANNQEGIKALCPTTHDELNHTNDHVNLEVDPSLVEPSSETPAPALTEPWKRPWSKGSS